MTAVEFRDRRLEAAVRSELALDPRIDDASSIAVGVQAGFVTLRGTVASVRQRRAAVRVVKRCLGVSGIGDRLQLRTAAAPRTARLSR
jgi:osmotically-inducible protein OsmY